MHRCEVFMRLSKGDHVEESSSASDSWVSC
uniref:Uncharacterized protein n=1 Tax=Anguilla anguilla TaxID=7936 RepID=A0A0E9QQK7_ANGAN